LKGKLIVCGVTAQKHQQKKRPISGEPRNPILRGGGDNLDHRGDQKSGSRILQIYIVGKLIREEDLITRGTKRNDVFNEKH